MTFLSFIAVFKSMTMHMQNFPFYITRKRNFHMTELSHSVHVMIKITDKRHINIIISYHFNQSIH